MDAREAQERLNRLFRDKLQAERDHDRDRAQVLASEILAAVLELGEPKALALAEMELMRNWHLLGSPEASLERGPRAFWFTDGEGHRRLYGT